jgi:hypothetical protein
LGGLAGLLIQPNAIETPAAGAGSKLGWTSAFGYREEESDNFRFVRVESGGKARIHLGSSKSKCWIVAAIGIR